METIGTSRSLLLYVAQCFHNDYFTSTLCRGRVPASCHGSGGNRSLHLAQGIAGGRRGTTLRPAGRGGKLTARTTVGVSRSGPRVMVLVSLSTRALNLTENVMLGAHDNIPVIPSHLHGL